MDNLGGSVVLYVGIAIVGVFALVLAAVALGFLVLTVVKIIGDFRSKSR